MTDTLRAADTAQRALEAVDDTLVRALAGSGADLLARRGTVGPVRRRYLAAAAKAATHADRRLVALRAELATLDEEPHPTVSLAVRRIAFADPGGGAMFSEFTFNRRIERALDEVGVWAHRVIRVQERLKQGMADAHERLAALRTQRPPRAFVSG